MLTSLSGTILFDLFLRLIGARFHAHACHFSFFLEGGCVGTSWELAGAWTCSALGVYGLPDHTVPLIAARRSRGDGTHESKCCSRCRRATLPPAELFFHMH